MSNHRPAQPGDQIDVADYVHHKPSGEDWMVGAVSNGQVIPCGWPLSYAPITDCTLTDKASDEERQKLLTELCAMQNSSDPRCRLARERHSRETTTPEAPQC
ncbi:hypothetical protein [uncultured Brevundimonas sp.]|uniref:hypothetical protein n=1 Tax=uncultured Brevundimonas sp. TaxID=213418 RepID=UPI0030EE30E5|tara:strand:- start:736 stop:1041 length:306 start_codon:yes stop_codon:yes gene_type:complete